MGVGFLILFLTGLSGFLFDRTVRLSPALALMTVGFADLCAACVLWGYYHRTEGTTLFGGLDRTAILLTGGRFILAGSIGALWSIGAKSIPTGTLGVVEIGWPFVTILLGLWFGDVTPRWSIWVGGGLIAMGSYVLLRYK